MRIINGLVAHHVVDLSGKIIVTFYADRNDRLFIIRAPVPLPGDKVDVIKQEVLPLVGFVPMVGMIR